MMHLAVQERLLALNRSFYATVASEFDSTRGGFPVGWTTLEPFLPRVPAGGALRVLDAGCGNGRFARFLDGRQQPTSYLGIDGDEQLLALAAEHTTGLAQVQTRFLQADLTVSGWGQRLSAAPFDLVVCLAVLHHIPHQRRRAHLLGELAALLQPQGLLVLSNWQFLASERFRQKQVAWASIGLDPADVEAGDALLPWNQGAHALRYVHQIDKDEVESLAQATGLGVEHSFYADGKEGNLNLYSLLRRCLPDKNRSMK
jgi:2-polyprenyl-3-methyl-5-hydroxy-6-metoxy-1,4-benzoquinol methylase